MMAEVPPTSTPVSKLKNIGATVAKRLQSVGIATRGDLARVGPVAAYRKMRRKYPDTTLPVCYYLYSLEAALAGRHWDELAPATKARLRNQAMKE
jgi:DNA transformation protein